MIVTSQEKASNVQHQAASEGVYPTIEFDHTLSLW